MSAACQLGGENVSVISGMSSSASAAQWRVISASRTRAAWRRRRRQHRGGMALGASSRRVIGAHRWPRRRRRHLGSALIGAAASAALAALISAVARNKLFFGGGVSRGARRGGAHRRSARRQRLISASRSASLALVAAAASRGVGARHRRHRSASRGIGGASGLIISASKTRRSYQHQRRIAGVSRGNIISAWRRSASAYRHRVVAAT